MRPIFKQALDSFEGIQKGQTERLAGLRETRPQKLETMALPAKQELGLQKGLAGRSIQGEGSRQFQQRADIGTNASQAEQDIEMQSLMDLTNQEGGLQQLDTQFTGIINEMAATGFKNELAGLQEEMNKYMAKEGAALDSAQMAMNARGATMDMYGRFAQAAGMEFGRQSNLPNTPKAGYQSSALAGDAYMPAYQQRF